MSKSDATMRRRIIALALAISGSTFLGGLPVVANAAPAPKPAITTTIPAETSLAGAIAKLQAAANDPTSLAAALAIFGGQAQRPANAAATAPGTTQAASATDFAQLLATANAALKKLGIQPFLNPSVSFNCVAPSSDNPFGLAPAVGGAVAGPWTFGTKLPNIPGVNIDPNVVKSGQVLYGFVPAGLTDDKNAKGMQVAWLNVDTLKGGFVDMGPAGSTLLDSWLSQVPAELNGIVKPILEPLVNALGPKGTRLAPVKTEKGTILSAVFGTVQNGDRNCFFFPMVGIVEAK